VSKIPSRRNWFLHENNIADFACSVIILCEILSLYYARLSNRKCWVAGKGRVAVTLTDGSSRPRIVNRWIQLIAVIIAMLAISNLQYAWTLFTAPLRASLHATLPEIQVAFSTFTLWPIPAWAICGISPLEFRIPSKG